MGGGGGWLLYYSDKKLAISPTHSTTLPVTLANGDRFSRVNTLLSVSRAFTTGSNGFNNFARLPRVPCLVALVTALFPLFFKGYILSRA